MMGNLSYSQVQYKYSDKSYAEYTYTRFRLMNGTVRSAQYLLTVDCLKIRCASLTILSKSTCAVMLVPC